MQPAGKPKIKLVQDMLILKAEVLELQDWITVWIPNIAIFDRRLKIKHFVEQVLFWQMQVLNLNDGCDG